MTTIYHQALKKWGPENQCWQAVEELGELMTALNQFRRGRVGIDALAEEVADVSIMIEQLRIFVDEIAQEGLVEQIKKKSCYDLRRPSWDEYFMAFARLASSRSTCLRRAVGVVIVKERRILATGYNGARRGIEHCDTAGCLRKELKIPSGERHEICRGVHAEQNAIIQAAMYGVSIKDATLYCTTFPCSICAKMIINAGINTVVFECCYKDRLSEKLFLDSGVLCRKFELIREV